MKPEFRKVQGIMNDSSLSIVIPKGMCKELGIEKGDTVKINPWYDIDTNKVIYLSVSKVQ